MPIICNKEENIFVIQTKNSSYVIEKNKDNSLTEVYWGTRVSRVEDFPTADEVIDIYYDADRESRCQVRCEYCSWGNRFYREPCIKVTFDDGVRDCELRYDAHKISDDKNELTLFLTDTHYKISVRLIYRIYPDLDFIDKRAIVKNTGDKPIIVSITRQYYRPRGQRNTQSRERPLNTERRLSSLGLYIQTAAIIRISP